MAPLSSLFGLLFPGQGAHYVGMGMTLYDAFPEARDVLDTADSLLGSNFLSVLREGPEDTLMATDVAQPAIFAVSYAVWKVFSGRYPSAIPCAAAGLSLGEYTALAAAGALPFEDGLMLVKKRGEIMQTVASQNPGAMASVLGLDTPSVTEICDGIDGAYVANYNSPGQIVISGETEAIERASAACKEAGAKRVIPLKVSGAFHSPLMREAQQQLLPLLEDISWHAPSFPVLSNVTGEPHGAPSTIPALLGRHVVESVRWEDNCRWMRAHECEALYELGPGTVLQGLMKKIDRDAQVVSIETFTDMESL